MTALRGLHVHVLDDDALGVIQRARPALVKTMDHGRDWKRLKAQHGIEFLLGREHLDDVADLAPTPEGAAEKLWRLMEPKVTPHQGVYDAIESPWNERFVKGGELVGHALATRRFCELAHDAGFRVAVGNFNVGTPEPWDLAEVFGIALERADYLSVHEYWLPDNFNRPWWCGRWRRLLDALPEDLRLSVIITECGVDGGLEEPPRARAAAGWRAYGMSGDHYATLLDAYWRTLDDDVLGMCVFNSGDFPGGSWGAFEVAGSEVEGWLAAGPRMADDPQPPVVEERPVQVIIDAGKHVERPAWRELTPWPLEWSQLADWSEDPDGDPNAKDNCLAASMVAAICHLWGLNLPQDFIHDLAAGDAQRGYLTVEQGARVLRETMGLAVDTFAGDGNTLLRPVVEESIGEGWPLIVLFAWDFNQFDATGHFCPVVGFDEDGVYLHEVWGGGRQFLTWSEFEAWQKYGNALRIRRRRDSQLSRF